MGHYMTKEGTPIKCQTCLYWTKKLIQVGTCGHANQKYGRSTYQFMKCEDYWPKGEFRK